MPVRAASLQAKRVAINSSGASEARGASHLINRNSLIPTASPRPFNDSTKGSATTRITPAASTKPV